MDNKCCKTGNAGFARRGVVLFVVIGGIFVLSILILSYNHLVQGKFNESREILKHLRALKTAQAASRFLISKLKADLSDASSKDENSPGYLLRTKVFLHNDAGKLSDEMEQVWLSKIDFNLLIKKLFGEQPTNDVTISCKVTFSDISLLNSLKEDNQLFLEFEKAGKMTVEIEVFIGNTREAWQESRPFRVVVPFPMPLTKYTMYLRQATDDANPVKFNTIAIESPASGNVAQGSDRPLIIDNGFPGDQFNRQLDIWKKRGWLYFGGGELLLNRAAGHLKFGQRYHSYYPEAENPITLLLNFTNFNGIDVNGHKMMFRIARWGFSDALITGPAADMWRKILEFQYSVHQPEKEKNWWMSTFLHLFGEAGSSDKDRHLSITRVTGKVYDRFLELSYLIPGSGSEPPVGAMVGLRDDDYASYSGKKRASTTDKPEDAEKITKDLFVDKNLVFLPAPPDSALGVPDLSDMEDFFIALPYSSPGNAIAYEKIMSKADYCQYDESYNMIAQYANNSQNINIPPKASVPEINDMNFGMSVMGIDCRNLKIDQIGECKDAAMGLSRRVCYEVEAQNSKDLFPLLKKHFCMPQNSDFNLANAVVRVKTGGKGLRFGDDLGANTGGTIIVDGPVETGTFRSTDSPEKAPLMILAEKGAITVKNTGQHPTLAYLVAMDKAGGEIKTTSKQTPIKLFGGIAAHSLNPDNFAGGGSLDYNQSFDPSADSFGGFVGVVIGPAGGEI